MAQSSELSFAQYRVAAGVRQSNRSVRTPSSVEVFICMKFYDLTLAQRKMVEICIILHSDRFSTRSQKGHHNWTRVSLTTSGKLS